MPTSAVWAGGLDGGSWIDCEPVAGQQYDCAIYYDDSGAMWEEGMFTFASSLREAGLPDSLHYSHFNGDAILLSEGAGSLERVSAPRSVR